jgi:hypothetical protein
MLLYLSPFAITIIGVTLCIRRQADVKDKWAPTFSTHPEDQKNDNEDPPTNPNNDALATTNDNELPDLLPLRPIFNSDSDCDNDSNSVPGDSQYNSNSNIDSDSDSNSNSKGESDSEGKASNGAHENDDYNYGNDDNDDVRVNNVTRASNINTNNVDAELPTATILPRRPLDSNQDHSDLTSNIDGVQTTANINASLENTPASQKSTASHTSQNPSTLTAFNLLHNRPSGNALDDCPGPLSDSI